MNQAIPGPGLVKGRKAPVVAERRVQLIRVVDGWWAWVLHHADIHSEGSVVLEPADPGRDASSRAAPRFSYYGTTSLRCVLDPLRGPCPAMSPDEIARLVSCDPRARLRVLRIAHREAAVRAGGTLSVLQAEIATRTLGDDPRGPTLCVDVDVSAEVLERHHHLPAAR